MGSSLFTTKLDSIIASGNRGHQGPGVVGESTVRCADGFSMSVIAGGGTYCHPRPTLCLHLPGHEMVHEPDGILDNVVHDYPGPYDMVEVGFPTQRPEPWTEWKQYAEEPDNPTGSVYGYVPVDMVTALVELHGGEVP